MPVGPWIVHGPLPRPRPPTHEAKHGIVRIPVHVRIAKPGAHPFVVDVVPISRQREIFVFNGRIFFERSLRKKQARKKGRAYRTRGQRGTEVHYSDAFVFSISLETKGGGPELPRFSGQFAFPVALAPPIPRHPRA